MTDDWGETTSDEPQPDLYFENVEAWFTQWLQHVYKRKIGRDGRVWNARWWENDEAQLLLTSLWQAWEHLRLEGGTAMAVYMRDFLYPLMDRLLSEVDGPFADLDPSDRHERTRPGAPLPHVPAPVGYWDEPDG